ncbi:hypothetical protein [Tenacibaculum sp. M341]|uniref:hypothetical protein n=1 Tax=Tenacibaculum sp. M341 TaxID=2530339 RepID=UPI001047A1C2|nr:hypothetical protein [Tenacibaculum sp. M341]TCI85444.1 hypothetical protein EYW44_16985 [Tenacibaculum sp. M341]
MKFEKDVPAFIFRIILIFILFVFILLLFESFTGGLFNISFNLACIYSLSLTFLSVFLLKYCIEILNNKLIVRNIFGIVINELNLNKPYTRKVKIRNAQLQGELLWRLLGMKYTKVTFINFKSEIEQINFTVSGHFLSEKGLKDLIKETKYQK